MTAIPAATPGRTPARNEMPGFRPYVWRAPRPGWMVAAIAAAEVEHGPPVPTCVCGAAIRVKTGGRCLGCGRDVSTVTGSMS